MILDPEFLNTYEEKHAAGLGFCQGLAPEEWVDPNGLPDEYPAAVRAYCLTEYHYWKAGETIGTAVRTGTVGDLARALVALVRLWRAA